MNAKAKCDAAVAHRKAEKGEDKCTCRNLPQPQSGVVPIETAGRDWQEKCYG